MVHLLLQKAILREQIARQWFAAKGAVHGLHDAGQVQAHPAFRFVLLLKLACKVTLASFDLGWSVLLLLPL